MGAEQSPSASTSASISAPVSVAISAPVSVTISASIVVCTRARGSRIVATLRSILAFCPPGVEVLVVDQSDDTDTLQALSPFLEDDRLCYIRAQSKGLGRARNIGLEAARGEIVAFTDDDCVVEAGWLDAHRQAFATHARVALCYGAVRAAPHDTGRGYVPDYTIAADHLCLTAREKRRARGIGANFAVRRDMVMQLGGFDALMGAGGEFCSAEDRDLTLRVLLAGCDVYETGQSAVVHHGFRDWQSGRAHTRSDWYGLGAVYAKPLRRGRWDALPYALEELVCHAVVPFARALLTGRTQKGWTRITAFGAGFARGLRTSTDRDRLLYAPIRGEQQEIHRAVRSERSSELEPERITQ